MKIIEKLSDYIEEELDDAEKYAKCAMKHKEDDVIMGKMFYDMSVDELKHSLMLHEQAVKLINAYKAEGKEVPEAMQAVYDYLHEKHVEKYNDIKVMQNTYKL